MNEENKLKTEHKKRVDRIIFVYHFYLFEYKHEEISNIALESGKYNFNNEEITKLNTLEKNIEKYEEFIINNLKKGWSLRRVEPFVKGILINGLLELDLKEADKAIIINEAIIISKEYSYDQSSKLINALLDKY